MKQKKEMIEIYYMGQNGQGCTVGEGGKKKEGVYYRTEYGIQGHFISCIRLLCQSCTADELSDLFL